MKNLHWKKGLFLGILLVNVSAYAMESVHQKDAPLPGKKKTKFARMIFPTIHLNSDDGSKKTQRYLAKRYALKGMSIGVSEKRKIEKKAPLGTHPGSPREVATNKIQNYLNKVAKIHPKVLQLLRNPQLKALRTLLLEECDREHGTQTREEAIKRSTGDMREPPLS